MRFSVSLIKKRTCELWTGNRSLTWHRDDKLFNTYRSCIEITTISKANVIIEMGVRRRILSRVGCMSRDKYLHAVLDIANLLHSLLHLYSLQFHNYCHRQYHNYFSCFHSLRRMLDCNWQHRKQLRDSNHCCVTSCLQALLGNAAESCLLLRSNRGRRRSVYWPVTVAAAVAPMLLRHRWKGGCPAYREYVTILSWSS
jgi:hypothetical protein